MRNYLKREREKHGFTQKYVAEQLGISQNYYCDIENGNRQNEIKASILVGLANIFGLSVDEIVNMENENKKGE